MLKYFYFMFLLNLVFSRLLAGDLESIFEKANKYFNEGNYEEASKCYLLAAKQNHPEALFKVGIMYFFGEGVQKNSKEAFKWFLRSAIHGYSVAQYYIAYFYFDGDFVDKDVDMALFWFSKVCNNPSAGLSDKVCCQSHISKIWKSKKEIENNFFEN